MTYNSLVTDLQSYSERSDANFVNQIPRLLMMAENRIATDLHILGYLTPMAGTLAIGEYTIAKPNFWRSTESMNFTDSNGNVEQILPRTYEFVRNFWPNPNLTKPPRYYADYDFNNWLLAPSADQPYTFEILVLVRQQPLDTTNTTNWLTANAPQLLLTACMVESQLWIKNFDRLPFWRNEYSGAMAGYSNQDMVRDSDKNVVVRPGHVQP
jgi:hypothetical protein